MLDVVIATVCGLVGAGSLAMGWDRFYYGKGSDAVAGARLIGMGVLLFVAARVVWYLHAHP